MLKSEIFDKFRSFLDTDWMLFLSEKYKKIPELYKKNFWIVFIAVNFVFLFHTINFLWGNHDWLAIRYGLGWDSFFYNGRYSAVAIKMLLLKGQVLPILNNLLAFAGFSLASVALMSYWKAPQNLRQRVILCLLLTCTPFTNVWLWFAYHSVENLTAPLFVILGLIFALKSNGEKLYQNILFNLVSIFCLVFALGIYPSVIVNIFVIFLGRVLIESFDWNGTKEAFLQKMNLFKFSFINILISLALYKFILFIMGAKGFLLDIVNIKNASITDIIHNLLPSIKACVYQCYHYRFICMPQSITSYFLVLMIIALIVIFYHIISDQSDLKIKIKKLLFSLISLFLVLWATKTAAVLAVIEMFQSVRIDFYGLMFFRVLMVLILFKYVRFNLFKNVAYVLSIVILWLSLLSNYVCVKSYKLGFEAEQMRTNRMLEILETNPNYQFGKLYKIIQIGYPQPIRPMYIPGKFSGGGREVALGSHTFTPEWNALLVFEFWEPEFIIKEPKYFIDEVQNNQNKILLNNLNDEDISQIKNEDLNDLKAYPSKDFIKVTDDTIYIVFSKDSLSAFRNMIMSTQEEDKVE